MNNSTLINKVYWKEIEKLSFSFYKNQPFPGITLFDFFEEKVYQQLKKEIIQAKFQPEKNWLIHSYSSAKSSPIFKRILFNAEFQQFLSAVINKKIKIINSSLHKFSQGSYTIVSDKITEQPGMDLILDFTPHWNNPYGGYSSYVDGKGNSLTIPVGENTLSIIERKTGINSFVKYVNHLAGNRNRVFLLVKLETR